MHDYVFVNNTISFGVEKREKKISCHCIFTRVKQVTNFQKNKMDWRGMGSYMGLTTLLIRYVRSKKKSILS